MSRAEKVFKVIDALPFAKALGMRCEIYGDEMTAILPFQERLIGNQAIQALHGGAIGAFLELTAMAQLYLESDLERPPKPIDLTIDYLRSGRPETLYARAYVRKLGSRMASVHAEAWQTDRSKPVAALRAQFLVDTPKED
ncbi:MAG: PaaI family thioesterase [Hyphomonadaceae bacterium]|nr:PaaI family thioesterase [Hyphomonadaceae bacterium]